MARVGKTVIHRHSGWLIPLGFVLAVLGLCALFLAWYLRPGPPGEARSGAVAKVALSLEGLKIVGARQSYRGAAGATR